MFVELNCIIEACFTEIYSKLEFSPESYDETKKIMIPKKIP